MSHVADRFNSHYVFAQELRRMTGCKDVHIHEDTEINCAEPQAEYLAAVKRPVVTVDIEELDRIKTLLGDRYF